MFDNFNLRQWILEALYRIPGILIGLSFHEWAHAYAAYKRGDPTARNLGRMTVNPIAHLDP
ncbi:MAG TPA: site-2 protease family protein, partial [Clostridia bacterium]|nr:site-2 protease family protein [Clostridia bacterium]